MPGHDESLMIRVILYLILIALIAFGAVRLAERPGEVAITWQGQRLDTSVMVLVAAAVTLAVASALAWSILYGILRAPAAIARYASRSRPPRSTQRSSAAMRLLPSLRR